MIRKRIEVKDLNELKANGNVKLSLGALFFSIPWCCITPVGLSLLGFFGAAGATRLFLVEVLFPLFIVSLLLLGRAHYLIYYKRHGSRISKTVTWAFTVGALALWASRFGLMAI
ncbi:MAG: hypothetical protein WBD99_06010 [Thermodesulfobacteriota bacterium]